LWGDLKEKRVEKKHPKERNLKENLHPDGEIKGERLFRRIEIGVKPTPNQKRNESRNEVST